MGDRTRIRMYANQKTPSSSTPIPSGFVHQRPFPVPAPDTETSLPQPIPDLQARLEVLRRANPDWSKVKFSSNPAKAVQPRLTVGAPNDQYEQEADRVADQVMSVPDTAVPQPVQREAMSEEEEVRTKPLAASITPLVQREEMPEEDEKAVQPKAIASIQREVLPEENEETNSIQPKTIATSDLQREEIPEDEGEMQRKPLSHSTLQRSPDGSFQADGNLESRLSSSQGGGSPLPDDVRSFMEPRFGADFSQVRVHTGSDAVQMNRDLNAQAFTHKQDVYFEAGKVPANDALTAHELTHVMQQTGTTQIKLLQQGREGKRVNRKLISPLQQLTEKDWYESEMKSWALDINKLSSTKNSFIKATIFNTQNNHPEEYQTIAERSAYYDVIDALSAVGIIPKKIRFFGAASKVTGRNSVGSLEGFVGWSLHSKEAIKILTEVNKILFASNMKIIEQLMSSQGRIVDPKNSESTNSLPAIQFDLNMVEVEQSIVEKYLQTEISKIPAEAKKEAIQDINDDLNFKGFWRTLAEFTLADTKSIEWAKMVLRTNTLDFMQRNHREAIGKALVFQLHKNTFLEYLSYIDSGKFPTDRLPNDYRGSFSMGMKSE